MTAATAVKDHPILFSSPMVRALLAGRKSVTRRMSKQWLKVKAGDHLWVRETWGCPRADHPRCKDGRKPAEGDKIVYLANDADAHQWDRPGHPGIGGFVWRPSIHMPRWACRIQLEALEDAREVRLWDMDEAEALREGVLPMAVTQQDVDDAQSGDDLTIAKLARAFGPGQFTAKCEFMNLWRTLQTKSGERWEANPTVIRVGAFRRIA